ncbi:PEP-CTERM sorting domain-containing protein [Luteolibacter pohnpeiensis]|nr:PEP-CTERM sorting domain-containing protein [Luteolibacter pohnpeiensis]
MKVGRLSTALVAVGLMGLGGVAQAAAVYVTTSDGGIWQYDSVADMFSQTSSVTSGVLVATQASYATDQGSTMDLSTGHIYRVTGSGDVVEYATLSGYLANTGGATIATALFTGSTALNGFSYDGNTGGFYGTMPSNGDVRSWASMADVLTNTGTTAAASYGGNLFNLYDPDGTTLIAGGGGVYTAGDEFEGHYYQSAGNGNLEGWATVTLYAASPTNRGTLVGSDTQNVFGGNTTAWGANVDAVAAFAVPEPSVAILGCLGLLGLVRRRR